MYCGDVMSSVLMMVNRFEDMGFRVDRGTMYVNEDPLEKCRGVALGFWYRPTDRLVPVYGV